MLSCFVVSSRWFFGGQGREAAWRVAAASCLCKVVKRGLMVPLGNAGSVLRLGRDAVNGQMTEDAQSLSPSSIHTIGIIGRLYCLLLGATACFTVVSKVSCFSEISAVSNLY